MLDESPALPTAVYAGEDLFLGLSVPLVESEPERLMDKPDGTSDQGRKED
jgi:hypothetical protein